MNKARRKAIADLIDRLDTLKGLADEIRSDLETIKDEEREAFENLSESFQGSDRGQAMGAVADALKKPWAPWMRSGQHRSGRRIYEHGIGVMSMLLPLERFACSSTSMAKTLRSTGRPADGRSRLPSDGGRRGQN